MKKHKWSIFFGTSLLAGIIGTKFMQPKKNESRKAIWSLYVGHWQFNHKFLKMKHSLRITDEFTLFWDQKPLNLEILQLSKDQLVLRDAYGFSLSIRRDQERPVTLYDEAEDFTYHLIPSN